MKHNSSEKGQALILIALAMIGLVGFSALAIDGGRSLSDRRHAQNAADSAALSAALAKVNNQNYTTAAQNIANSNGYNTDADSTVVINLCNDSGVTCEGLPSGADSSEYIRVRITSIVPTTFARVLGRNQVTNTVEAITRVQGSTSPPSTPSSSPSSSGTFFNGAAMVATRGGNVNQCFLMNGSADLYTHNSGIYVNCSGSQALFMNGGSDLQMDAMGQVVGCYAYNGGASFDPIACAANAGVSQTIDATTFADVPTTVSPPTCSSNGSASGTTTDRSINGTPPSVTINSGKTSTLSPGNFNSIIVNGSGATAIFSPGIYCISGNFNLNGNSVMSGPSGRVIFVLQNQNIVLNGGSAIDFNDLEIYGNNSSFLLNGNAIFRADRLRIFFTGNGTFTVNGGSELSSADAYIYLKNGNLTWNGSSLLNLHAPPAGDPFAGLLVHMPWNSTTENITFNGGSNIHLTGTFLAPRRHITFNGGVNFELHSQIIGYEYTVNGGGDVDIYFQADENYSPPNSGGNNNNNAPGATIELIK